jgi:hypothetical protein
VDVERLLQDLKYVRGHGIPKTRLDDVPALKEALARRRPDLTDADRTHMLAEVLAESANQLDDHDKKGIQLALGIGGLAHHPADGRVLNSADRRAAFAAHYQSAAETVRRRDGLEDQTLTKLAKAILGLYALEYAPAFSGEASTTNADAVIRPAGLAAQISVPTTTSRPRAYYAIDSFEQDLRQFVESRLLDHLPPEDVLGAEYDQLRARRAQENYSETGPLTRYLHPHHAYDALLRNADALTLEISEVLQRNLSAFDGFLAVRNRLMHGRPLQPDDLEETDSFLRRFLSGPFRQTELALAQLAADSGWQPRPRAGSQPPERILHNLPSPDFDETGLLGREAQVNAIVDLVKRRREPVTLVGDAGIGKTALALEVCYRLADDPEPPFDAILWTSLKRERLTPAGVFDLSNAVRDIEGATRELGKAIDHSFRGSAQELADAVGKRATLIVIDNLETASGNEVLDLYDALPDTVSFLFTSKVGIGQIDRLVAVGPLDELSGGSLFRSFARDRGQSELADLAPVVVADILRQLRYSPLAIRWYILSVAAGRTSSDTLRNQDDLLVFCVEHVIHDLGSDEKRLLAVLYALDRPVLQEELAVISKMEIDTVRRGAHRLRQSSLIVWSQSPSPDQLELGSERLALSSTARLYLRAVATPEIEQDIIRRDNAYNQEREQERERIADHGRYLDPNVIFERSAHDSPTAHLLKQALRENKSGHTEAASATMAQARAISPDYFEVDRVDAIHAGYRRATERATALFQSALKSCETEEEISWVSFFFAGHLARQVHDIPGAITMARRSHEFFNTYDTALQLGNFNVWDHRFEEGQRLIEAALERAPSKPRFERSATTSLVDCLGRWSEESEAGDPTVALDRALRGTSLGIRLHESGSTDEQLMGSIVRAATAALHAAKRKGELSSDEETSLTNVLQRLTADDHFNMIPQWRGLQYAVASLAPDLRSRLAPGLVVTLMEPIDPSAVRILGSVWSLQKTFGFITHRDFPRRVYFNRGSLRFPTTLDDLNVGSMVEFTPCTNEEGKDQARDVLLPGRDDNPASAADE